MAMRPTYGQWGQPVNPVQRVRLPARPPGIPTNPGLGGAYTAFRGTPSGVDTAGWAAWRDSHQPQQAQQPVAPAAGGGGTDTASAPKPPDPLDSTYTTGVAGLLFNNRNQRDDLNTQGGQATQDFNTMLGRMAENRANDLLAQNYAANKQGLFYSGQLGKRRDTVEKGYGNQQSDAQTAYDRASQARAAALDRLGTITADPNSPTGYTGTGQAGLTLADLMNQAIGRQTTANAGGGGDLAAALGIGPESAAPAPAADAEAPPAVPVGTAQTSQPTSGTAIKIAGSAAHGGAKWVYHRAASGQWIPIRPA